MTRGEEAVAVAVDRSASSGAKGLWKMGQGIALSWADEAGRIDFIPFSALFTVYPNVDQQGVLEAIQREHTGQSTRIAGLLRYCFNDYVMWKMSGRKTPVRLVLVCDGEPDDIDQAEIELRRFIENRVSASSPFVLEIVTQTPWPKYESVFKTDLGAFKGVFNTHLFRINHDRPSYY